MQPPQQLSNTKIGIQSDPNRYRTVGPRLKPTVERPGPGRIAGRGVVIGDLSTLGTHRYSHLSTVLSGDDATTIARSSGSLQRPPPSSARRPALFLIIIDYKSRWRALRHGVREFSRWLSVPRCAVLRRCEPGHFDMGSKTDDETRAGVRYYFGVFPESQNLRHVL